jgi:hypothetical protein
MLEGGKRRWKPISGSGGCWKVWRGGARWFEPLAALGGGERRLEAIGGVERWLKAVGTVERW